MNKHLLFIALLFFITAIYPNGNSSGVRDLNCFVPVFVYVDINVIGGNNDGSSWNNAYVELQDALVNSNDSDEIWVASGTYLPDWNGTIHNQDKTELFLITKELSIYGGFNGTEITVSDRDWRVNRTIFSGDLNNDDVISFPNFSNVIDNTGRIIQVSGGLNSVILDGFEIISGNSVSINQSVIRLIGNISMSNCSIYNNQGGNSVIEEPAGQSRLENCLIYNNYNTNNNTIFSHDIGTDLINFIVVYNHGINRSGFLNGAYLTEAIQYRSLDREGWLG